MNVSPTDQYKHTLRRRGPSKSTKTFGYGLAILFLFGILAAVFQLSTSTTTTSITTTSGKLAAQPKHTGVDTAVLDVDAALFESISIVACDVSTPHTKRDGKNTGNENWIANGRFEIAILNEDLEREGSSAAAFWELVGDDERYYDGTYAFRAIPEHLVQWGLRDDKRKANAAGARKLPEADHPLVDHDESPSALTTKLAQKLKVLRQKHNVRGVVTMIKGNTGHVFINTGDNHEMDKDGTLPFGIILDANERPQQTWLNGMMLVDNIYSGYAAGSGQVSAIKDHSIPTKFPEMARFDRCYRVSATDSNITS